MATTGATFYFRPRNDAATAAGRVTGAAIYFRPRTEAATAAGRVTGATFYARPLLTATTAANRVAGATFYFRPRTNATSASGKKTSAIFVISARASSGVFTSVGIDPAADLTNLRSFLPHSRQPWANPDGTINTAWYRFFQVFVDVFLSGSGRYTLADIINAVVTSQENTTTLANTTAAVAQQTQTNAEALAVVKQVIVDNSLTGAEQIPDVQLSQGSNIS